MPFPLLFTKALFLVFFGATFAVYWSLPRNAARKVWLLICSYAFYAAWDWRFLSLIIGSSLLDYFMGALIARSDSSPSARRRYLAISLIGNLGCLAVFKYLNFFVESGARFLDWIGLSVSTPTLEILLPVGISFYTFQSLSYTIDIYRGNLRPVERLLDFALFVAFFPQLVAGPIVRAAQFLPQLAEKRRFGDVEVRAALVLFLIGYIKKACIADRVASVIDGIFADPTAFSDGSLWLAVTLYAVQIYCDFSGYTDMAIASAALLGYRLAKNFDFPYLARSITDFWRRWHMTLSSWFRDYLYIPLGGNRGSAARTYRNLFLVFFLCGLWHGANWTFVAWGLFHGALLVFERVVGPERFERVPGALRHAYVALSVTLGWVLFRSPDVGAALATFAGMTGFGPDEPKIVAAEWWWLVAGFLAVHVLMTRRLVERGAAALADWQFSMAYGVAVALVLPWAASDYQAFIYFQF